MNLKFSSMYFWFGLLGLVFGFLVVLVPGFVMGYLSQMPWMHVAGSAAILLSLLLWQRDGVVESDMMRFAVWLALAVFAWPFWASLVQNFSLMGLVYALVAVAPLGLDLMGWTKWFHD